MIELHSIGKMQQIQKDTKNFIFMHIALLVFSKKIWNKFKRFKLRLQTIYQFLAETLLLTSWGQQLTELRQEYKKFFSLSQSDDPTKKGAKIQNEYMFLLRCIMATSWIGNIYFSYSLLFVHLIPSCLFFAEIQCKVHVGLPKQATHKLA